jgi:hypothetical protein
MEKVHLICDVMSCELFGKEAALSTKRHELVDKGRSLVMCDVMSRKSVGENITSLTCTCAWWKKSVNEVERRVLAEKGRSSDDVCKLLAKPK